MDTIEKILKASSKYFKRLDKYEQQRLKGLLKLYKDARLEVLDMILKTPEIPSYKRLWAENLIIEIEKYIDQELTPKVTDYRLSTTEEAFRKGIEESYLEIRIGVSDVEITESMMHLPTESIKMIANNIPNLAGQVSNEIKNKIREELTKGVIKGESVQKIAKRVAGTGLTQEGLKKPFQSIYGRALTITRTEIIKASDEGTDSLLKRANEVLDEPLYEKYLPHYDERTTNICKRLGAGLDTRFKQVPGLPPGVYYLGKGPRPIIDSHINCRSRRIPFMPKWIEYDKSFNFEEAIKHTKKL